MADRSRSSDFFGSSRAESIRAGKIDYARPYSKREPYAPGWTEQELFFEELTPHLRTMADCVGNTGGARPGDLRAGMDLGAPRTGTRPPEFQRTVLIIPAEATKRFTGDDRARLVVLTILRNGAWTHIACCIRGTCSPT